MNAHTAVLDAVGPEPSKMLLPTTDYLYNMTDRNISRWLVKTTMDYVKKRYVHMLLYLSSSVVFVAVVVKLQTVYALLQMQSFCQTVC